MFLSVLLSCVWFLSENASGDSQMVPLSVSSIQFTQTQIYISRMRTGHKPMNRFLRIEYYRIENEVCDGKTKMSFTIDFKTYVCPINDDLFTQNFNDTHAFDCPTFCQVCNKDMKCLRTSYSDIFYTPDGRSIDNITFHYGILDRPEEREINYFIFWAYLFIFFVFTGFIVFAFTE